MRPRGDTGFTLIELLVALALFALISLAGVSLVETVIGVQTRTAERARRLAELQRGLFMITSDFAAVTGDLRRDGDRVTLTRSSRDGAYQVSYEVREAALHRIVNGIDHPLIGAVRQGRWRYLKQGAWVAEPTTEDQPDRPAAVELVLDLAPTASLGGSVRRVVELPGTAETS